MLYEVNLSVCEANTVSWTSSEFIPIRTVDYPSYDGPTTVTPSEAVQTLATADSAVHDDITINPIPSNYGLITYSGSIITVS